MITKYIVKDDHIELYENDCLIDTIENTENNLKIVKLLNDNEFVNLDIVKALFINEQYRSITRKYALISLIFMVIAILVNVFHIPFINTLSVYLLGLNIIIFVINNDRYKKSSDRLNYLEKVKKKIIEKIEEYKNSLDKNKASNHSLEFSYEQLVDHHRQWITNYGDEYDFNSDIDYIRSNKILIKK